MWNDLLRWLGDTARGSAGRLVGVAIVLLVVLLATRWARRAASTSISESGARYRARKLIGVAGVLLALLVTGVAFSSSLAGLPLILGVTAAGIAFALQEVIASVAGWLVITSGGAFHAGDRIELAGVKGDVIDISVLRTTLMEIGQWVDGDLYSGRIVKVGNSAVFKQPVFNYTAHFPFLWDEVKVPVQYGSDRAQARAILEAAAAEVCGAYARRAAQSWSKMVRRYLIENASVEPMVSLVATDNWLEFTVRYPVDAKWRRTTRDRLFTRILDGIDASGGCGHDGVDHDADPAVAAAAADDRPPTTAAAPRPRPPPPRNRSATHDPGPVAPARDRLDVPARLARRDAVPPDRDPRRHLAGRRRDRAGPGRRRGLARRPDPAGAAVRGDHPGRDPVPGRHHHQVARPGPQRPAIERDRAARLPDHGRGGRPRPAGSRSRPG